ncbi:hypothetical protein M8J77_013912 [Diaphorina citri]|nr:hypothetical protein M8J77_013912 [Diaphorina citri]
MTHEEYHFFSSQNRDVLLKFIVLEAREPFTALHSGALDIHIPCSLFNTSRYQFDVRTNVPAKNTHFKGEQNRPIWGTKLLTCALEAPCRERETIKVGSYEARKASSV